MSCINNRKSQWLLGISILIFINGAFSFIIPPNDPLYYNKGIAVREDNNLELYLQPYPYFVGEFQDLRLLPPTIHVSNGMVRGLSKLKFSRSVPKIQTDIWASYTFKNFSFLSAVSAINKYYGISDFGESYNRAGLVGLYRYGYIQHNSEHIIIQFGRRPIKWGQSWDNSIILSGNSPAFNNVSFTINAGLFQVEYFVGQLHSVKNSSLGRIKRYIGGKKYSMISHNKDFIVSIGDIILYSGLDRSFEMQYMNPIIPFILSDLERETGGNDNNVIFACARFNYNDSFSSFFELFIDDFQVDIENRDSIQDGLAIKLGLNGTSNIFNSLVSFELDYSRVMGYTYITNELYTNWEERDIPLGFNHGPDSQAIRLLVDCWYNDRVLIGYHLEYLEKGELTFNSVHDPYGKVGTPFPSGKVKYQLLIDLNISKHSNLGIWRLGITNRLQGSNHIMLYFTAQLVINKLLN